MNEQKQKGELAEYLVYWQIRPGLIRSFRLHFPKF
jgi:hypothetical protein